MSARATLVPVALFALAALLAPLGPVRADDDAPILVVRHEDGRDTSRLELRPGGVLLRSDDGRKGEALARGYLADGSDRYGVEKGLGDVGLTTRIQKSLAGQHYTFAQQIEGVPLRGATVTVTLDPTGRDVLCVYCNAWPRVARRVDRAALTNVIGPDEAIRRAWQHLRAGGQLLERPTATLVIEPGREAFRVAYVVHLAVTSPYGFFELLVQAGDGRVLSALDRRHMKRGPPEGGAPAPPTGSGGDLAKALAAFEAPAELDVSRRANGKGRVFDPDPRTTLQKHDLQDDSPAPEFEPAYEWRVLEDLAVAGGVHHLDGLWVRIVDFDPPRTAPGTSRDGTFSAKRGDNTFNDVMTYFHIGQNQTYIQMLGFAGDKAILATPIEADANGANGRDESYFDPPTNRLSFGHGCVDDNEDADVILHEYGHAIQHAIVGRDWRGGDTGAMGEGFGDYWAASYSLRTTNGARYRPAEVFSWDAHGEGDKCWKGRRLDRLDARYDPGRRYGAHTDLGRFNSDELWSTPLFQALLALRAKNVAHDEVDTIVLEAYFGIGPNATMRDMAHVVVEVAKRLFPAGPHADVFRAKFEHHEILPSSSDEGGDGG